MIHAYMHAYKHTAKPCSDYSGPISVFRIALSRFSQEFRGFLGNAEARGSCLAEDVGDVGVMLQLDGCILHLRCLGFQGLGCLGGLEFRVLVQCRAVERKLAGFRILNCQGPSERFGKP